MVGARVTDALMDAVTDVLKDVLMDVLTDAFTEALTVAVSSSRDGEATRVARLCSRGLGTSARTRAPSPVPSRVALAASRPSGRRGDRGIDAEEVEEIDVVVGVVGVCVVVVVAVAVDVVVAVVVAIRSVVNPRSPRGPPLEITTVGIGCDAGGSGRMGRSDSWEGLRRFVRGMSTSRYLRCTLKLGDLWVPGHPPLFRKASRCADSGAMNGLQPPTRADTDQNPSALSLRFCPRRIGDDHAASRERPSRP